MKINQILVLLLFSIILSFHNSSFAAVEDYLLLNDIGSYKFITENVHPLTKKVTTIPGYTTRTAPGILAGADHFDTDHDDTVYEIVYESDVTDLGVRVQITQHAGSDSDRWLLHELERGFRKSKSLHEIYVAPNPIREISGNKIWYTWGYYRWLSNNIIISIEYSDIPGTKPEPLEVVQAYLSKFPSTITFTNSEVKDRSHSDQWLKNEMERRLWLCDKWFGQLELGKVDQDTALKGTVKSLNKFLDYREKYFGLKASGEKQSLWEYEQANNEAGIRAKLQEYKDWWAKNKADRIRL